MSEDLESRLRAALRPVAPGDGLTRYIIARVATDASSRAAWRDQRRPRRKTSAWWLTASMAASLLIAIGVLHNLQERREQQRGLEARRQVIEALRVTSQKLDLAYEVIRSQSSSPPDDKPGV
jgi:hypothetical protein